MESNVGVPGRNAVSGLIGKAMLKSKVNSASRSVSDSMSEPEQGVPLTKGKKGKVTASDRKQYALQARNEMAVLYRLLSREKRFSIYSRDEAAALVLENFARPDKNMYPVSAWRCGGRLSTTASLAELADICFSFQHRRRWDSELSKECRIMSPLDSDPNATQLEYEARGPSMGGVVSGRGYVDLRGKSVEAEQAIVYWGSVEWQQEFEDGLVRGWNFPGGISWERVAPNEFVLKLTVHRDVKGWLPYAANEQAMPGSIFFWWKALADYVRKLHPIDGDESSSSNSNRKTAAQPVRAAGPPPSLPSRSARNNNSSSGSSSSNNQKYASSSKVEDDIWS